VGYVTTKLRRWSWVAKVVTIALLATGAVGTVGAVGTTPAHASSTVRLIDGQTGWCLDSNYSGNVYTLPCNGGNFQNWLMVPVHQSNDTFAFRDAQTGTCLYDFYINSGLEGVRTAPCDYNAPEQQFGESFPAMGVRNFASWWDSRDCLDSNYGTGTVGAAYETPCNGGPWQVWQLG
jgi:hypothetical protein